jgi:Mn-dependent DtxR family transcriptional regulator
MDDERPLRFADAAETERRQALLERFLQEVLGLPWAFVSDESHLSDFDGVLTRDELITRCQALYGATLQPHHFSMPIWRVLDELEAARDRRNLN